MHDGSDQPTAAGGAAAGLSSLLARTALLEPRVGKASGLSLGPMLGKGYQGADTVQTRSKLGSQAEATTTTPDPGINIETQLTHQVTRPIVHHRPAQIDWFLLPTWSKVLNSIRYPSILSALAPSKFSALIAFFSLPQLPLRQPSASTPTQNAPAQSAPVIPDPKPVS